MKKNILIVMFCFSLMMSAAGVCQAQGPLCCCELECLWSWTIMNPLCELDVEHPDFPEELSIVTNYSGCIAVEEDDKEDCESYENAREQCLKTEQDALQQAQELGEKFCKGSFLTPIPRVLLDDPNPADARCTFVAGEECAAVYLLGEKSTGLGVVQRFRDEVLAASPAGQKIIRLYYRHDDDLIAILTKSPEAYDAAQGMLQVIIPVLGWLMDQ